MNRQLALAVMVAVALSACDWTTFNNLSNEAWARSTQSPNVGATDYAVALAPGASTSASTSGGTLAVLSEQSPTFSTIAYDAHGNPNATANQDHLADDQIATLPSAPILIADGMGHIAMAGQSTATGQVTIRSGSNSALSDVTFASSMPPDAGTYAGSTVVVSAGLTIASLVPGSTSPVTCPIPAQNLGSNATGFAALTADATTVYGWTDAGELVSMSLASLTDQSCATTPLTVAPILGTPVNPVDGASMFVTTTTASEDIMLIGHGSSSPGGYVLVVPLTNPISATVIATDGVEAATLGALGSGSAATYLALGLPASTVDGVSGGKVELYEVDPTTSIPAATASETIYCDEPTANQQYGRAITFLPYNGATILSVAASNEVFTYFQTQLYPDTRQ